MTNIKKILAITSITVIFGVTIISFLLRRFEEENKQNFLQFLSVTQSAINRERVASLKGDSTDLNSPDYIRLKEQLSTIADSYPGVRYVYLMHYSQGKVHFLVDTKSKSTSDESLASPGEEYEEATETLLSVFNSGKNITVGPETDKWGTFISALGPIFGSDGRIIALVGADIDASDWNKNQIKFVLPYVAVIILLVFLEIFSVLYSNRYQAHKQMLAHLASIVDSSHDAIVGLNKDGTVRSWNKGAQEIFGYTPLEAIGKKGSEIVYLPHQTHDFKELYGRALGGEKLQSLQIERRTKDNRKVTLLISANPIYKNQEVVGISVIAKDITKDSDSKSTLTLRNKELEKLNQLMIDREFKIVELKNQIKKLQSKK